MGGDKTNFLENESSGNVLDVSLTVCTAVAWLPFQVRD